MTRRRAGAHDGPGSVEVWVRGLQCIAARCIAPGTRRHRNFSPPLSDRNLPVRLLIKPDELTERSNGDIWTGIAGRCFWANAGRDHLSLWRALRDPADLD